MSASLEQATMRKVAWRLVPFLCLLYIIAFIIRINVGFASLTMGEDLGLTSEMLGWGAGLFFISYFFFEVPSNLMLYKFGARRWIARVMISMGLVSLAFVFIQGPWSLYLLRLLLGVAEAGLFPGVIFYITLWFPKQWRGRVTAAFVAAIPVSSFIAGPLSGALLQLDGTAGIAGWQWMFILEALPAIVIGFVTLRHLTSTPAEATWLNQDERDWLIERLRSEQTDTRHSHSPKEVLGSLLSWQVIRLALIYFGLTTGLYGIELWLPLIIKGFGLGTMAVGLVSAIPYLVALVAMALWARHVDKSSDRFGNVAWPCAVAFTGLVAAGIFHDQAGLVVAFLSVAIAGVMSARPPFWTLPTEFLEGRKAAAGIAAINSIGNLGGFTGPYLIGWAKTATGSFTLGLMLAAVPLLAAVLFAFSLRRASRLQHRPA
jgi:ACS family tartrate transporter-like MFS transporter